MKNNPLFLLVMLVAGITPCFAKTVSAEVPAYVYTGEKPIYPAIIYAVIHGNDAKWKEAKLASFDIEKNVYVFDEINGTDGIKLAKFTLTVTVTNGNIEYAYSNIRTKGITDRAWASASSFFLFDKRVISNHFNTMLPKVMGDAALYESALQEADKIVGPQKSTAKPISFTCANPNGKPFYPAFFTSYVNAKTKLPALKYSEIASMDTFANTFVISNVIMANGMTPQMYDINISIKDGAICFDTANIQKLSSSLIMKMSDSDLDNLPVFDVSAITNELGKKIVSTMADAPSYAQAKKEFLSNTTALLSLMKSLTQITQEDFIETELKNSEVSYTGEISAVEKNTVKEYPAYKYKMTMILWHPVLKTIEGHIYYYTNSIPLSRTANGAVITVDGVFANYIDNYGKPDFQITGK